jgi:arsenate reductase
MMQRVLFLCTGNSARSQMAEGILRSRSDGTIEVFSAGTNPKGLNPLAVRTMAEIGIDISGHWSKDVREFETQHFDVVITVCHNARESCPVFPASQTIHWNIPDPVDLDAFRKVRDDLVRRVDVFLDKSRL